MGKCARLFSPDALFISVKLPDSLSAKKFYRKIKFLFVFHKFYTAVLNMINRSDYLYAIGHM